MTLGGSPAGLAGLPAPAAAVAWAIDERFAPVKSLRWYRNAGGECSALEWCRLWTAELERRRVPAVQLELPLA